MKSLFRQRRDADLVEMYCKANNLRTVGNTVFPKRVYIVYYTLSVLWCAATGAFAIWSMLHNSKGFIIGLVAFLVAYAAIFFFMQTKYGTSRDEIEEEVMLMQRLGKR